MKMRMKMMRGSGCTVDDGGGGYGLFPSPVLAPGDDGDNGPEECGREVGGGAEKGAVKKIPEPAEPNFGLDVGGACEVQQGKELLAGGEQGQQREGRRGKCREDGDESFAAAGKGGGESHAGGEEDRFADVGEK